MPDLSKYTEEHETEYMEVNEALKFIKRMNRVTFFASISMFSYTKTPDAEGKGGSGYDLNESITVSKREALVLIGKKIEFAERKKETHYIRIARVRNCIFI